MVRLQRLMFLKNQNMDPLIIFGSFSIILNWKGKTKNHPRQ